MKKFPAAFKREMLNKNFLFSQISPAELDHIIALGREKYVNDAEVIFQKNDPGDYLLAVLQGRVLVTNTSNDGKTIMLNTIETGQIFGEMALLDGKHRSANATAEGACILLVIYRRDFIPLLKQHPDLALHLLTVLCQKLRDISDMAANLGLLTVSVRLARFLLEKSETLGKQTQEGLYLDLRLSQSEIGTIVGAARESVNKHLSKWQKNGIIKLGNNCDIILLDVNALEEIAAF